MNIWLSCSGHSLAPIFMYLHATCAGMFASLCLALPQIMVHALGGSSDVPQIAVLASDGLWDTVKSGEAVMNAQTALKQHGDLDM